MTFDSYYSLVISIIEVCGIENQTSFHQLYFQLAVCQPKHFRFMPVGLNLYDYGQVASIYGRISRYTIDNSASYVCIEEIEFYSEQKTKVAFLIE